jgi:hypothetical protein
MMDDPDTPDRDVPLGLRDGDRGIYKVCKDPECPANRPGTKHAHFDRFERDGETEPRNWPAE